MDASLQVTILRPLKMHDRPRLLESSPKDGAPDMAIASQWQALAGTVADLTSTNETPGRRVRLNISFGALGAGTSLWGARFWEEDAPSTVQAVDWVLLSQHPVGSVEEALSVLRSRSDLVIRFGCQ